MSLSLILFAFLANSHAQSKSGIVGYFRNKRLSESHDLFYWFVSKIRPGDIYIYTYIHIFRENTTKKFFIRNHDHARS